MKIEPIIGEVIDVKNDFGMPNEGEGKNDEKDSDGSGDLNAAGMLTKKFLDYDLEIESIFTSSNMSDLSYLCIVSKLRFSIFYIQDDNIGGTDFSLIWDNDYRFNRQLKQMGQILSLDFENSCKTFVVGTQLGWICLWDFSERAMRYRIRVKNIATD